MGRIFKFYCNACGTPFTPETRKGRACSDKCRLAINNAHMVIKATDPNLSVDEQKQSDELVVMIESAGGVMRRIKGVKTDGKFIIKEEDMVRKNAAKKGTKVAKNDKNLIPGEMGKEQEKLNKKEKKKAKKEDK